MSDIEQITWIELGEKLEAIVAHSKQRLPGEWPIALDDKFVELMNDACQYFPYEIASAEVLSSSDAPTTTPKNPLASEVERLKSEVDGYTEAFDIQEKIVSELRASDSRSTEVALIANVKLREVREELEFVKIDRKSEKDWADSYFKETEKLKDELSKAQEKIKELKERIGQLEIGLL